MLAANELFLQRQVAIFVFPEGDALAVVEVYDELSYLACFVVFVGHHDERRMQETLTVNRILPVLVGYDFGDLLLAKITAQVILIVFVGAARDVLGLCADPSFEAKIVDIFDRARAFADVEQRILMRRGLAEANPAKFSIAA